MKRLGETIHVNNEKALADALHDQYGIIILEGGCSRFYAKIIRKIQNKTKGTGLGRYRYGNRIAVLATIYRQFSYVINYIR